MRIYLRIITGNIKPAGHRIENLFTPGGGVFVIFDETKSAVIAVHRGPIISIRFKFPGLIIGFPRGQIRQLRMMKSIIQKISLTVILCLLLPDAIIAGSAGEEGPDDIT